MHDRIHLRASLAARARTAMLAGAIAVAAALTQATAAAAADVDVEITKFAFAPKEITVTPGTRVAFVNRDETPHTVSATDKSFASKGLDTGERYEHVFDAEGDYAYLCTIHPFMTGVVHVRKR